MRVWQLHSRSQKRMQLDQEAQGRSEAEACSFADESVRTQWWIPNRTDKISSIHFVGHDKERMR